ncbi:MAG: PrpR N-terminal domain-containing protein [Oscillospiraceae bacterium]
MQKYKILVIVPYEGFGSLVRYVADKVEKFSNLDLDIVTVPLTGLKRYFHSANLSGYEAIISRGRHFDEIAKLAKNHIEVFNVEFSAFDILRCLQMVEYSTYHKIACISFCDIAADIDTLADLIGLKSKVEFILPPPPATSEEMEALIVRLYEREDVKLFIGDGACCKIARKLNYDNILITSGFQSVREALSYTQWICKVKRAAINKEGLLVDIIKKSQVPISVYDPTGALIFSSLYTSGNVSVDLGLEQHVPRALKQREMKFIVSKNGNSYRVRSRCVEHDGTEYVIFYVIHSFSNTLKNRNSYEVFSSEDVRESLLHMTNSSVLSHMLENVSARLYTRPPVFVSGNSGTGKETFIYALYSMSSLSVNPIIVINCLKLDMQSLARIFQDEQSAFLENDYTLYFKKIHALSIPLQRKLEFFLGESQICSRNQILCSFTGNPKEAIAQNLFSRDLYQMLSGIPVDIPDLSERSADIPNIVHYLLHQINKNLLQQISWVEPAAMELLKKYEWTEGCHQLKETIKVLASAADSPVITKEQVARFLAKGKQNIVKKEQSILSELDLSMPLCEIERNIVRIVYCQEGMNQTKAAQRLGISRTSLWKKLNKQ